ncbi:MAG: hypothetical protein ABIN01_24665, partial [Ferruginibacter sp.]
MDRNDFLQTLFTGAERKKTAKIKIPAAALESAAGTVAPFATGINPYTGPWTENEMMHLLKRLSFGAPREQVTDFMYFTYSEAVDLLLNSLNTPANMGEPVKVYSTDTIS